jgi:hypothetical protein
VCHIVSILSLLDESYFSCCCFFEHILTILTTILTTCKLFFLDEIAHDFESKLLQRIWNQFRVQTLSQSAASNQAAVARLQQLRHNQALAQAQRAPRLAQLDTAIEHYNAKFADIIVETDYTSQRLLQKYNEASLIEESDYCLGPRAHLIDCFTKYAPDTRPCGAYVDALEQCVATVISVDAATTMQE